MYKKYVVLSICCILSVFLLISCKQSDIDLSYFKKPDNILLIGDAYKYEIKALNEEFKKSINKKDKEAEQKIFNQILDYNKKASLNIKDKQFIDAVFDEILNSKGYVSNILNNNIVNISNFTLELSYNSTSEMKKEEYLSSVIIFENGSVLLPVYDEKSESKHITVETKISKKIVSYIKNYYEEHLRSSVH